jgi:hypothetical protein
MAALHERDMGTIMLLLLIVKISGTSGLPREPEAVRTKAT